MNQPTRRDHAQLLARARAAIETPSDLDADAIHHLIEDLSIAEALVNRHVVPWPVEIHVGHIDHRHGTNFYATFCHDALIADLAEYCRDNWSEIDDPRDPQALTDEEVLSIYFDNEGDEFYSTESIYWEPTTEGEREGD
ncbi:hypothetical protein PX699_16795 [Sphingobium sp. H39-3-25]|uniref:hypothetical protein n=1 Tax=Sphingomonadales TaxID=204457 RepID=UPI000836081C|nr:MULTISPECIES: hypothetical protein [Sphingomonadaceae]MDF0491462.1 hypothetical protein [Sphingomonas pollutisoli]MDF0544012.1 hypothetical protein [Sphingobium arseniciresistens]